MSAQSLLLPEASSIAPRIDVLFWYSIGLCSAVALGIFAVMLFYAVRYRHGSSADREGRHKQSLGVEITWTLVPFALFVGMFVWSMFLFVKLHTPPTNAQTIYVVAKQWMWKVQHPGGQREIDTLHVPLNMPVRLVMISQDVIHSFYVPAFRVKQDVLPGSYTQLWFTATKLGRFPFFCSQYCGLDHSRMIGTVEVMRPADFAAWLQQHPGPSSLAARGAEVFRRLGCSGCHGANASVHAPDLDGLFGRKVHLADGTTVIADDRYIRDSILLPHSQVVAGYSPIMPAFTGQISESDLLAVIAYLKSTASHTTPVTASESTHARD